MAEKKSKKQKHGHYSDRPRFNLINEYEGDFKKKYEKSTVNMVKEILKTSKAFLG